jgi:hypothetical protein
MSCALLSARDVSSLLWWRGRARSCRWWYFLPSVSVQAGWLSFTHWRIYPNRFQWMPCCGSQRRRHSAGLPAHNMRVGNLRILKIRSLTRRNYMLLDLIIIVVTIVTFVAFIGFTEGCERL